MTKFTVFLSILISLNLSALSEELKVGIVDMTRVFGEYYKTKEVEKEIEKKKEIARSEVNERDGELKEKMDELKALEKEITDPVSSREVRANAQKKAQKVTEEASFIDDLGADSLDTVELVMAFEEEFGSEISDSDAEKILTVGDAVKFIENKAN